MSRDFHILKNSGGAHCDSKVMWQLGLNQRTFESFSHAIGVNKEHLWGQTRRRPQCWEFCLGWLRYWPIGSMVLPYMVTFTINIPPMLAYIPAPWILWAIWPFTYLGWPATYLFRSVVSFSLAIFGPKVRSKRRKRSGGRSVRRPAKWAWARLKSYWLGWPRGAMTAAMVTQKEGSWWIWKMTQKHSPILGAIFLGGYRMDGTWKQYPWRHMGEIISGRQCDEQSPMKLGSVVCKWVWLVWLQGFRGVVND